jgi:hypothetical protein
MEHCSRKIGEAYFRTPRTTITAFVNLLSVLEQNKNVDWRDLLGAVDIKPDINLDLDISPEEVESTTSTAGAVPVPIAPADEGESLATFKL